MSCALAFVLTVGVITAAVVACRALETFDSIRCERYRTELKKAEREAQTEERRIGFQA